MKSLRLASPDFRFRLPSPFRSLALSLSPALALSLRGKNSDENNICARRQNFFHVVAKLLWVCMNWDTAVLQFIELYILDKKIFLNKIKI